MIDLGAWANEDYKIGDQQPPDEFDTTTPE